MGPILLALLLFAASCCGAPSRLLGLGEFMDSESLVNNGHLNDKTQGSDDPAEILRHGFTRNNNITFNFTISIKLNITDKEDSGLIGPLAASLDLVKPEDKNVAPVIAPYSTRYYYNPYGYNFGNGLGMPPQMPEESQIQSSPPPPKLQV